MKSVLIISTNTIEERGLKQVVEAQRLHGEYQFETSASFGQDANWWANEGPDLVVIMMPEDEILQGFFIRKLVKDVPKTMPVVFVAKAVAGSFLELSTAFKKIRTLKHPIDADQLFRSIHELLLVRPPSQQQRHQRYDVDLRAKVVNTNSTEKTEVEVEVKNLSLGGARFEFFKDEDVPEVGSRLGVEIITSAESTPYNFIAEVVWTDGKGAGVQFIQPEES